MDAGQFNQLIQGLTTLVGQIQAQNNAAAAAAAAGAPMITAISPYKGGTLDINSHTGSILYQEAIRALDEDYLYNGKSEHLYPFIAANSCTAHAPLRVPCNGIIMYSSDGNGDCLQTTCCRAPICPSRQV